ncbi:helix-turn-helix transcriptional regulator [Xenorhabdus sp. DI]|uniref:XRE family transcriptional regulator n=1 Tax=Xenorhabdus doucetiae TaxID=351671 RepID=UPI0019B5F810|nr:MULTISPECIES: helix-turn-helix transcriptional regulator [unclassified Xenorhabdus]MBD2785407.1 helix-turn-helix transcriptional regulator [Xenorhabdus sp. 3]MBD2788431.1 helix-turn-helix transcriptional regulator [Xenorhabdus sp. DI]MBD2798334.1 helix-turn-helix transcriptional regulator [Xenorhabdus sp. 18]
MKTMHERIKQARLAKKITQAELADKLGVTPQSVQQWEASTEPRKSRLTALASILDVDVSWLLFGEAPKKDINQVPPEDEWTTIAAWDNATPVNGDEVEVPFLKDIEFACGNGCCVDTDYNGYKLRFAKSTLRRIGADSNGSTTLCFPARGNSMEPVIPDGATVAIDTANKRIVDGKVYAIEQDGLKRLKILHRRPKGKLLIRSYNREEYEDEVADESSVNIIGKMFWYSVIDY